MLRTEHLAAETEEVKGYHAYSITPATMKQNGAIRSQAVYISHAESLSDESHTLAICRQF
jgi:hypothetical protein